MLKSKWFWSVLYLASILLGNIFVDRFGIVKLTVADLHKPDAPYFFIVFPAGVVFIGLTFSFRDYVQRLWGDWACWIWMAMACALTVLMSWQLALASFLAFLVSESADWAAFKFLKMPFRNRILISNLISCPLDSAVFVTLAFGWFWPAIWGQALIKYLSGLLVLPLIRRN